MALWASCLCIYLSKGKGGAVMHVYIWEHIVIVTTEPYNGYLRNLVEMKCSWPRTLGVFAISTQGADPGQGGGGLL